MSLYLLMHTTRIGFIPFPTFATMSVHLPMPSWVHPSISSNEMSFLSALRMTYVLLLSFQCIAHVLTFYCIDRVLCRFSRYYCSRYSVQLFAPRIRIIDIACIGCIACPLRAFMTSDEIAALFHISNPKLIIGHPSTVQLLQDALKSYGRELPVLVMATTEAPAGTQLFSDFLKPTERQQEPLPSISPESPSHLLCTSGTTGAYKLVSTR